MDEQEHGAQARPRPGARPVTLRTVGWLIAAGLLGLLMTTSCIVMMPPADQIPSDPATCADSLDCKDTEFCNADQACQPKPCDDSADCACNQPNPDVAGVCVAPQELVPCQSAADCTANQTCDVERDNPVCVDNAALAVAAGLLFTVNGNQPVVAGRPLPLELMLTQQPGNPQVSSFTIQFPPGAVLFKPFTPGANIGSVFNATTTSTVTLVAGDNSSAFADVNASGTRDPGEAQLRVHAEGGSVRDIFVRNPFGGDFDPNQHLVTIGQSLRVVLNPAFFRAGFDGQYLLNAHLRVETGAGISQGIPLVVQALEPLSMDYDSAGSGLSSASVMSATGGRVTLGPYEVSVGTSGVYSTAKIRLNMSGPSGAAFQAASPGSACIVINPFSVECNFAAPGGTPTSTTARFLVDVPNAGTVFYFGEVTQDDGDTALVRGRIISQASPSASSPYLAVLQAPGQAGNSFTGNLAITSPGPLTADVDAFLFAEPPAAASSATFGPFTTIPSVAVQTSPTAPQRSFLATSNPGSVRVNFGVSRQSDVFVAFGIQINGGPFVDFGLPVGKTNASVAPPMITAVAPASGIVGAEVVITGTGLSGVTEVRFNGVSAGPPTMVSATQVRVLVPAAATTGFITLIGPGFTLQSPAIFKVLPRITTFSPLTGIAGAAATINGSGFTGATEVAFGGVVAASFNVVTNSQITTTVPSGGKTGKITVKTAGGTATSTTDFVVINPPTIGAVTPLAAAVDATITITGTELNTVSDVAFAMATTATGTAVISSGPRRPAVAPITRSATSLTVKVPAGATTGKITVINPAGAVQSATPFRVVPAITAFSPAAVIVGGNVSITGTSFTGTTAVRFGTINAPFTVLSDSQITAAVPPGALGMVMVAVVTPGGTATTTLQSFGVLGISTTTLVPAAANVSYTQTLMPAGGRAPFTWSLLGGALPAGMNLSAAGVITGKSPTPGISNFTARVGDSLNQSAAKTFDLVVNLGAFSATCAPANGEVGVAYSQTACVPKGGLPPYACSLLSGNVSAGLTLNGNCTLTGTPTAAGSKTWTTRVADSGGLAVNVSTTQMVLPAVQVTTTTLLPAKANMSYTTTLLASGGKLPYTWALVGGNISPGFTLSTAGVISGSSGVLGPRGFNVSVTDALGGNNTRPLSLTVNLGPLSATCAPPAGEVGVPYAQTACVPKLGLPPYACSLLSGNTSAGTTLNSDCTLSGTPTTAGTKTFMSRVSDSGGSAVGVATTHVVLPAVQVTTTTLPAAKANMSYTTTLMAAGGKLPYGWSVVGGSLPAGFNVSAAGVISGKSGVLGFTPFTVRATDALGGVDDQLLQLAVNLGPLTATCMPPNGEVGVAYNQAACVPKLGLPPYTCSLASGNTSAGTTLNGDCTLSGTPTAAGARTFMTRVMDSGGLFVTMSTTHTVLSAVQVNTTTLPAAKANTSYITTLLAAGGKMPYAWSIVGGGLPAGFNLSVAGVISGKSAVLGFTPFTVRATDTLGGFDDQDLFLAVNRGLLTATCAPPTGEANVPYNGTACTPGGGLPPFACSLFSGNTSAGLTLNSDCTLSGTPTAAGMKTFMTRVADSGGLALNVGTMVNILPAVQITTTSVPAATVNKSYTTTLAAIAGKTPYVWSVASGNLSAGLTLAPATGVLSGIATVLGINDVTVRATDALGGFDDQLIRLVTNLGPLSVTCLPKLSSANTSYSTTCPGSGGLPPYSCALNSGTPPTGINVNADCSVSGIPTVTGSKTFSVKLTDSANASAMASLSIVVANHVGIATTSPLPDGKVGVAYSKMLMFTPSVNPYTWTLVSGPLPNGLGLAASGLLSGMPQAGSAGVYPLTIRVTDGSGGTADKDFSLTISP